MCSSRGSEAPSSTAEISTAGTTFRPCCSPAATASATPATVSGSEGASSSTPASAARPTTSAAARTPSELVEWDWRSKRGGTGGRRASGGLLRAQLVSGSSEDANASVDGAAQAADGCVVTVGLLGEERGGEVAPWIQAICGGVGLGGAGAGFEPEDCQGRQRGARVVCP